MPPSLSLPAMTAGIGESVVTEIVSALVLKLWAMGFEAAGSLSGVENEIESIASELTTLSSFLRAAQEKPERVREAKRWLKQVRRLVYDIEDCIEESILHLGQLDAKDLGISCLRRAIHQIRKLWVRHRISTKIKTLETRVKGVRKSGKLCLHTTATLYSRALHLHASRAAGTFVDDADFVGMDKSREELIGLLLAEDQPQLRVVSVVGMGGLGKTTLVRKVYESPTVSDVQGFRHRAWITMSQSPNIKELMKSMIEQLIPLPTENGMAPEESALVTKIFREKETADVTLLIDNLRGYLNNKRYVVVLDDVWSVHHLKSIRSSLPYSKNMGSRIIVTTRFLNVADVCCVHGLGHLYQLQLLTHHQSWDLFCKRAFQGPCPPELEDISDGIVKKCGGLPLAIVTIGALLAVPPNRSREVWQMLLHRLHHELEANPHLDMMSQILNLSFHDLPSHLKQCFLYLTLFPEGYSIRRKRLIRLWVALGFVTVTPAPDATPEEAAEGYFDELINRSVIQPSELGINGKVRSCRVHDVVREVIITKAKEEMSISMIELGEDTRHLSVHGLKYYFPGDKRLAQIRSLILFGDGTTSSMSPSMRLLRVLDLQGCRFVEDGHFETICKFLFLKYLNLRGVRLRELPYSLGKLENLETLDIRDNSAELQLPTTVIKLKKLRHLLSSTSHSIINSANCPFPSATGMGLPGGISKLKSLLTLSYVDSDRCSEGTIKELKELTELRKLSIVLRTEKSGMELCAALEKLSSCLRSLTVWTASEFKGFSFLDSLASPPLRLISLKLGGHLEVLPSWVASLDSVAKIVLYGSEIREDALQVLQALPSLIELRLYSIFEKHLWFGGDGFKSLKFLCLNAEGFVQTVFFEPGAMPKLEKLLIRSYGLRDGPLGINNLVSLKEIAVVDWIDDEQRAVLEKIAGAHPNHPGLITVNTTNTMSNKIKF